MENNPIDLRLWFLTKITYLKDEDARAFAAGIRTGMNLVELELSLGHTTINKRLWSPLYSEEYRDLTVEEKVELMRKELGDKGKLLTVFIFCHPERMESVHYTTGIADFAKVLMQAYRFLHDYYEEATLETYFFFYMEWLKEMVDIAIM